MIYNSWKKHPKDSTLCLNSLKGETLLHISATVKHSSHFLCRTQSCIIGPGKYRLNNWTADNSLEQWMGGCRGETAVQTPCLTASYISPSPPSEHLFPSPPADQQGLSHAKADVPTSSLSSSFKRQAIHYDPIMESVYSVPFYHRCTVRTSSLLQTETNKTWSAEPIFCWGHNIE